MDENAMMQQQVVKITKCPPVRCFVMEQRRRERIDAIAEKNLARRAQEQLEWERAQIKLRKRLYF